MEKNEFVSFSACSGQCTRPIIRYARAIDYQEFPAMLVSCRVRGSIISFNAMAAIKNVSASAWDTKSINPFALEVHFFTVFSSPISKRLVPSCNWHNSVNVHDCARTRLYPSDLSTTRVYSSHIVGQITDETTWDNLTFSPTYTTPSKSLWPFSSPHSS